MADDQQPIDPAQGQDDSQVTEPSALPEDNGTPAQPADDTDVVLGEQHPATDSATNIDEHQAYDEGVAAAAEASEPADPGVSNYTPPAPDDGQSSEDGSSDGAESEAGDESDDQPAAV